MATEVLHVTEADAARDLAAILDRVQAGAEVVIERDARPIAVVRAPEQPPWSLSEAIALAKAHEEETGEVPVMDPDFAEDVREIVRNRQPWTPRSWD